MRILFIHRAFPGQFRYLASVLAGDRSNQVVFLTAGEGGEIPGVHKAVYRPARTAHRETHPYLQGLEGAVLHGQAAAKTATALKRSGFLPDIIIGHSGWGPTMFMRDIFPRSPLVCYFEWFYRSRGSSFGFDPDEPLSSDNEAEIRLKNAPVLLDLAACDSGISPTRWQLAQFPAEFQHKIGVVHEGIDTAFFRPDADRDLIIPRLGLDLGRMDEVVTYVATGLEPLRGFPQFMEALSVLQQRRPKLQAVIVGEDRPEYGVPAPDGQSYKELVLAKHDFDMARIHFTGRLSVEEYRKVLLASTVHVYLTYPFILSWSVLEAMACSCLVVGSATPPVQEVIGDRVNGLLADFFASDELADKVELALADRDRLAGLRRRARETILAEYDVSQLLPRQLSFLQATARRMGA